jgi:hypothetical protein
MVPTSSRLVITRLLKIGLLAWMVAGCRAGPAIDTAHHDLFAPEPDAAVTAPDALVSDDEPAPAAPPPVIIAAVGDVMPGSVTPIPFLPEPTNRKIPDGIRALISQADVVFGNLEGTFMVEAMTPVKCRPESREAGRCYEFGFPPFLASFLKEAGFTVLSLDNNHAEDYGLPGYVFTQGLLAQTGVAAVPKRSPIVFPVREATVAIVPFGFSGRSFHLSDIEAARSIIADINRHADIVVVSFHGGAEGEHASRVADVSEEYFGEDRGNVLRFAHAVVDAGADLVLGHGPHVPRAVELYRGRLIAYSLGNFWTYGNVSIKGMKGIMPLLRVALAHDGTFLSGRLVSMRQRLPGVPEPDPEGQAVRLIAKASQEDFPSSPLIITEAGDLRTAPQDEAGNKRTKGCAEEVSPECIEGDLWPPN